MNPKEENSVVTNKPSNEALQLAYQYIINHVLPRMIADEACSDSDPADKQSDD